MGEPSRPDRRSDAALAYRSWYGTARWKRRRAEQLQAEPFCCFCIEQSGVYTMATVADHVTPHHGSEQAFWQGKLQSLCKTHHDRDKKLIEAGTPLLGVDEEGWPL